jgi:Holliday junction resolvase-like predicted endonuclease
LRRRAPDFSRSVRPALHRVRSINQTRATLPLRASSLLPLGVLGVRPDYIEHQLAHAVRDPNGRAYNRTAHLPERRKMMQQWADYLEHRKNVELAAERAVVGYYKMKGFTKRRVATLNCGYDFIFTKGRTVHHVEVKGTAAANERFFLTRNENKSRNDARWRLAMVTHALAEQSNVKTYNNQEFNAAFDLEPYVFVGKRIDEPKKA